MDDNETYDPTWRDDSELYSLLLAAKTASLADLDGVLDIEAGHRAIIARDLPAPGSPSITGRSPAHQHPRNVRIRA